MYSKAKENKATIEKSTNSTYSLATTSTVHDTTTTSFDYATTIPHISNVITHLSNTPVAHLDMKTSPAEQAIKILQCKMKSLFNNYPDLNLLINKFAPHIIALQETHLSANKTAYTPRKYIGHSNQPDALSNHKTITLDYT